MLILSAFQYSHFFAILCFICSSVVSALFCFLKSIIDGLYIALPFNLCVYIQVSNLFMYHPDLETQEKDMKLSFSSYGKHLMISKVVLLTLECFFRGLIFQKY